MTAETLTKNYSWTKPVISGSASTWGGFLNGDLDSIDAIVFSNQQAIGALNTQLTANALTLNKPNVAASSVVVGASLGLDRWAVYLGDGTAESGSNSGSNFSVARFTDGGTYIDAPFSIIRQTGNATFTQNVYVNGTVQAAAVVSTGDVDASGNVNASGGVFATGNIITTANTVQGAYVHSTGNLQVDGNANVTGNINTTNTVNAAALNTTGVLTVGGNIIVAQSTSGNNFALTQVGSNLNLQFAPSWTWTWNNSNHLLAWETPNGSVFVVDLNGTLTIQGNAYKPGGGSWTAISDDRTKQHVVPYASGLNEIERLEPIAFRYNGQGKTSDDGRTYYGLSAQATQPIMPELVVEMSGEGLLEGQLGTELGPLTLALVNAVKELGGRVKALEAQLAMR